MQNVQKKSGRFTLVYNGIRLNSDQLYKFCKWIYKNY